MTFDMFNCIVQFCKLVNVTCLTFRARYSVPSVEAIKYENVQYYTTSCVVLYINSAIYFTFTTFTLPLLQHLIPVKYNLKVLLKFFFFIYLFYFEMLWLTFSWNCHKEDKDQILRQEDLSDTEACSRLAILSTTNAKSVS